MFGAVVIMVFGFLIHPCVLPLVMRSVLTLLNEKRLQVHLLQGYQRVNPIPEDEKDDAF
jgi:hypothetical protein